MQFLGSWQWGEPLAPQDFALTTPPWLLSGLGMDLHSIPIPRMEILIGLSWSHAVCVVLWLNSAGI